MGKRFRKGETDGREGGGGGGGGGGRLNEEELKALAHKTSFSLANVKDFHEVQFYKYLLVMSLGQSVTPSSFLIS